MVVESKNKDDEKIIFLSNSVINNIKQIKTYSQASQDVFVINLLQHKKNGYFVGGL